MMRRLAAGSVLLVAIAGSGSLAQTVSGTTFEDRDADGVRDAGEPPVPGVAVTLLGTRDVGGAFDQSLSTDALGAYGFSPGNGCYVVSPQDPPGWRLTGPRLELLPSSTPGYPFPVGRSRFAKLDQGIANLRSGALRFTAMGDSIAYNFNLCGYGESFAYSKRIRERLACAAPAAAVSLDQAAVKGEHTDDLLVDDNADLNNVFRAIELQPDLVTLSMIGNDLLDVDPAGMPSQAQVNAAVAEVLDARRNLQEALSTLTSEIPGADIVLNTLYDNLAYACATGNTSPFHAAWLPIVNRILADVAWGQARRASILDAAAELAQEDLLGACTGFAGMICRDTFGLDRIHPNNNGYSILQEKGWESVGGVSLGPRDVLGRTSQSADWGYLRRIRRVLPSAWETRAGAGVSSPEAALDDADNDAAAALTLGAGSEEFRLTGFPDWFDEDEIVRAIVGVRYRTTGSVGDDAYRMEASIDGAFAPPPGHPYSPTAWNFVTPIVGGGGPNAPPENSDYPAARVLALPNVAVWRTVTASFTKDPLLPPGSSRYAWPAVRADELATSAVRVVAAPVAGTPGNDAYSILLDAAWVDLYGWQRPRPAEVSNLRLAGLADGTLELSFAPVAGAARYNAYAGDLGALRGGVYDHGADPSCGASTADAGGGNLKIALSLASQPSAPAYFLITAHVDDVESPSGHRTGGVEIERAQSSCR
jgi:hypothetical protein